MTDLLEAIKGYISAKIYEAEEMHRDNIADYNYEEAKEERLRIEVLEEAENAITAFEEKEGVCVKLKNM